MAMSDKGGQPKFWSTTDIAQLDSMMSQQIDPKEIASQLGRTKRAVQAKFWALQRQRNGPTKRQQRSYNRASFFLS